MLRSREVNAGGAEHRCVRIPFISLSVPPHQIEPIATRAAVELILRWYLVCVSFLLG